MDVILVSHKRGRTWRLRLESPLHIVQFATGLGLLLASGAAMVWLATSPMMLQLVHDIGQSELVAVVAPAVGVALAAAFALRSRTKDQSPSQSIRNSIDASIEAYIAQRMEQQVAKLVAGQMKEQIVSADTINDIRDKVVSDVVSKASDEILEGLKKTTSSKQAADRVIEMLDEIKSRLSTQAATLSLRANVNLVIGLFISMLGLTLLGWTLFRLGPTNIEAIDRSQIYFFLTRLTLMIVVEVLAYFFLNLYRASLHESRFYQNEISTMEARYFSVALARETLPPEAFAQHLKSLSILDRNRGDSGAKLANDNLELEKSAVNLIRELISKPIKEI